MTASTYCNQCTPSTEVSDKSGVAIFLICFFFGFLGMHRFYVGRYITGLIMLFTMGLFGIWTLVDLVLILLNKFKDSNGKKVMIFYNRSNILFCFAFILGVCIVSSIFSSLINLPLGINGTIKAQLSALNSKDYTKAYSFTSSEFQKKYSKDDFEKMISEHPILKDNTGFKAVESEGIVKGVLEEGNETTPVEIGIIKEKDDWKISSLEIK